MNKIASTSFAFNTVILYKCDDFASQLSCVVGLCGANVICLAMAGNHYRANRVNRCFYNNLPIYAHFIASRMMHKRTIKDCNGIVAFVQHPLF